MCSRENRNINPYATYLPSPTLVWNMYEYMYVYIQCSLTHTRQATAKWNKIINSMHIVIFCQRLNHLGLWNFANTRYIWMCQPLFILLVEWISIQHQHTAIYSQRAVQCYGCRENIDQIFFARPFFTAMHELQCAHREDAGVCGTTITLRSPPKYRRSDNNDGERALSLQKVCIKCICMQNREYFWGGFAIVKANAAAALCGAQTYIFLVYGADEMPRYSLQKWRIYIIIIKIIMNYFIWIYEGWLRIN